MHGSGAVFCSCSLLIRGPILPAVRQKLHLSPCADTRSRLSIASTRIRCWGGSAASENRVYLMDWVQSRPQGFNCASAVHRLCVGSLVRECISQALVLVLRAPHGAFSPATTRSEPCRMAERRT